jgi:uncharacterized repeat protein (TIGR03803 family)
MNHIRFVKTVMARTLVVSLLSVGAWGSTYKVIWNFGGANGGSRPVDAGNLAIDANGNLYGTTQFGGACGLGTLFELSPNGSGGWTETVWYNFCGANGAGPTAAPTLAPFLDCDPACPMGNTVYGGTGNGGVFFECDFGPSSCKSFPYTNATHPYASPSWTVDDSIAGFEGPASVMFDGGQNGYGELNWCCGFPYDFCSVSGCADGANPASAVVQDGSGNIWGTTSAGGSNGQGTVYEWIAYDCPDHFGNLQYCYNSPVAVLHNFAGGSTDGSFPFFAGLTLQTTCSVGLCSQTIWGTTPMGGASAAAGGSGYGTVFAINQLSGFSLVHSFSLFDGVYPFAGLTNLNGTFYGTTSQGGFVGERCCPPRLQLGRGTIYSLTSSGTLTTLHTFTGPDGAQPFSGLVADSSGNLYGVTYFGGAFGAGVVYEITP